MKLDDGREIINHLPDEYQIHSDGTIHEVIKLHGYPYGSMVISSHLPPKPASEASAHYQIHSDGSVRQLIAPEEINWTSPDPIKKENEEN